MKTILTACILMAAIAVGTFSAFKYGLVDKAKDEAVSLVAKAVGNDESQPQIQPSGTKPAGAGIPKTAVESVAPLSSGNPIDVAMAAREIERQPIAAANRAQSGTASSLRPPSQTTTPPLSASAPAPSKPVQQISSSFTPAAVTVAKASLPQPASQQANANPARPIAAAALRPASSLPVADATVSESTKESVAPSSTSSLRPASSAQAQAQMQAIARQRAAQTQAAITRPTAAVSEDISAMTGPGMSPVPMLSETKARIKAIDQLLGSNPEEALRRIEELQAMPLEPDDAAETGYRRGYVARLLRDESNAEKAWKETAESYPELRGGRFSALALGDTWFHQYAGIRPQMSYWDDIQLMYSRALGKDDAPFLPEQVKTQVKQKLVRLNDAVFFGSAPSKLARYHKVEPGELLSTIANKYRVDYESIARINGIDPNRIRAGMDLKLVVGDVEVVVRKNEKEPQKQPTLTWFLDGRWVREYPCCVGEGSKTPAGTYTFTSKDRFPSWTNPVNGQLLPNDHPENILGSRWMAMKGMNTQGLGIHGTTVDDSIPGYTSAGCVRLLDKDVEELFSFGRVGGKVVILE